MSTKHLLFSLFLLFPFVLTTPSFGQTKVAYIDASRILKKMPEAIDANSRLEQIVATWNREAEEIQGELNRKSSEYERRKLIMTDAERTSVEVDVQNLRKRLDDYRQSKYGPGGELYTQQDQLMRPAYDKLLSTLREVASDGSYDYVFDRSSRDVALLYANAKHDLTLQVARKLNIETDAVSQPLLNEPRSAPPPRDLRQPTPDGKPVPPHEQPGGPGRRE